MNGPMRIGLFANMGRSGAGCAEESLLKWPAGTGNHVVMSSGLAEFTGECITHVPRRETARLSDIVVSMGGDGTMLASAREIGRAGTPILGINVGSLGFLTQLTPKQLVEALDAIAAGKYSIEDRMLLKATLDGDEQPEWPYALNDVVIDKGAVSRLIDVRFRVNGEDIVTYRADGIVIATPTGSTAYNLAVGGPILHPKMKGILAAPISSFSLTTRPMLFDRDDVLELTVESEGRVTSLTLDGQVMLPLQDGARVTITRADYALKFIVFPETSFYKVLRNKLHWGRPPRTGS
mgnify:FL=1